jgi:hypothetical protein
VEPYFSSLSVLKGKTFGSPFKKILLHSADSYGNIYHHRKTKFLILGLASRIGERSERDTCVENTFNFALTQLIANTGIILAIASCKRY